MSNLKQLLETGQDEAVQVNQRALIEKILARYSGEFTVFRELLQNADDASASTVEFHFRTTPSTSSSQQRAVHDKKNVPDLRKVPITTIMARNDGIVFREEDWNRLKKIAEGNPDETKIGAFGVGFYSLFSLCDEPLVSSGTKLMGFYWKNGGDQLFVKSATTSEGSGEEEMGPDGKPWTTFLMELREQAPMPEPHEFAKFLATCLGFTAKIQSVSMYFDSHLLCRITKTLAPTRPIKMNPSLASTSPLKILRLERVDEVPLQLRAEVSRWVSRYAPQKKKPALVESLAQSAANQLPSSLASATTSFASKMLAAFGGGSRSSSPATPPPRISEVHTPTPKEPEDDPFQLIPATLFLRTVSGQLKVSPPTHFANEMVRATKKSLPARTNYSLIWTGKDEFEAGLAAEGLDDKTGEARKVFAGLVSDLDTNGRVFIGFPTFQTTGCAASVAARFVSTVERESIDFQARYVNDWNRELLWAGGVLARTVYEEEMATVMRMYQSKGLEDEGKKRLEQRALHVMRFFTFSPSTPSPVVGSDTETTFFNSSGRTSITIISQLGPLPASDVRLPNPALAGFLKAVPTIPPSFEIAAPRLLATYREKNLVRDISLDDVLNDLGAHPLTIPEAILCFKWWLGLAANRSYSPHLIGKLKDAAMLSYARDDTTDEGKNDVSIAPLGGFRTFLNPSVVASSLPLPKHNLPFSLSKSFNAQDLSRVFQFEELSLVDWTKHLISPELTGKDANVDTNLLLSQPFAEKVLGALAKSWSNMNAQRQGEVVALLSPLAFIPTRQGPRVPAETYFANVDLFADLPIVTLPSGASVKGPMEKVLTALGVRRHVELQLVFTRLLGQGDWSHVELARYLVSVRDTLSNAELDRLRQTQWLPKEGEAKVHQPPGSDGAPKKPKTVRYQAKQLFEPSETFRALGLPVLDWTSSSHKWRPGSDEAKFLFELGLLRQPTVDQLLEVAAKPGNPVLQEKALRYFLDEYSNAGYGSIYSLAKHALPFVPAILDGKNIYAKPTEVYSNPTAALMGFPVLQNHLFPDAGRLKIASDPPAVALAAALTKSPPQDIPRAKAVFGYLSTQVSQFSSSQIANLSSAQVVPTTSTSPPVMKAPSLCFFSTDPSLPDGLKTLFTILPDFDRSSRPFLVAVGVKEAPSTAEIATMVVANPGKLLDLSGSAEKYISILRTIAVNYRSLPAGVRSDMRSAAFFLGTKRVASTSPTEKTLLDDDDEEESSGSLVYELTRATSLVLNDEPHTFRVFEGEVLACPQEEAIEELAEHLGAQRISRLVTHQYRTAGYPDEGSRRASELHRSVTERTALFLSERLQQYGKGELKYSDPEWIQKHLQVFEVQSIELVLTLNFDRRLKRVAQQASAYVKVAPNKDLQLYIGPDDMDFFYEAASGLCKHLLVRQRANDVLLLMTVLQTSLKNLKRRGYNVDRILNARQAAREAAEARLREERRQAQIRESNSIGADKLEAAVSQLSQLFPDADLDFLRSFIQKQASPFVENAANALLAMDYPKKPAPVKQIGGGVATPPTPYTPPTAASHSTPSPPQKDNYDSGLFSNFRKKLRNDKGAGGMTSSAPPLPTAPRPPLGSHTSGATPTSTDAIRSNVEKAIQAARPESSNKISNEVTKTQVKESESYCDSTSAANLTYVQDVEGLRFYVDQGVPNPREFVVQNHAALSRFVKLVVKPIGEVFTVDPRSLHIFHDLTGPLIAFNRGGSIYFNSRFYFAWHDAEVVRGQLHNALISVFHSMAHELAHNLVKPHDAQHSFYFSSLCETFFMRMTQLLTRGMGQAM
ncbi:hypothetical protein T439DRAFT_328208 [Meredithblackwellia eburnea MCA 4105]